MDKKERREMMKMGKISEKYEKYYYIMDAMKTGLKWGVILGGAIGIAMMVIVFTVVTDGFIVKLVDGLLFVVVSIVMVTGMAIAWCIAPEIWPFESFFFLDFLIVRALFAALAGGGVWPIAIICVFCILQYKHYENAMDAIEQKQGNTIS